MEVTEISIIVITVVLVALSIFLLRFIYLGCKTLKRINHLVHSVQKQVDDLGHEPKNLLHNANEVTVDLHKKMQSLDPWFHIAPKETQEDKISSLIQWALSGLGLWQRFRK